MAVCVYARAAQFIAGKCIMQAFIAKRAIIKPVFGRSFGYTLSVCVEGGGEGAQEQLSLLRKSVLCSLSM